jgi:hypothetical protein
MPSTCRLAGNLQSLPLFDTSRLRRHIEAAYHTMSNIHLAWRTAAQLCG